jgi:hypothetical protein
MCVIDRCPSPGAGSIFCEKHKAIWAGSGEQKRIDAIFSEQYEDEDEEAEAARILQGRVQSAITDFVRRIEAEERNSDPVPGPAPEEKKGLGQQQLSVRSGETGGS